jgi:hypothetical protein
VQTAYSSQPPTVRRCPERFANRGVEVGREKSVADSRTLVPPRKIRPQFYGYKCVQHQASGRSHQDCGGGEDEDEAGGRLHERDERADPGNEDSLEQ